RLKGIRIFTLGIDQAVNEAFLKRLAGLGGGYCELVESEDRLDTVMDKVHRRIRSPLLSSVRLEPAGLKFEPATVVRGRGPDVFPGTPVVILGRFQGSHAALDGGICIQATDDAGRPWSATVAGAPGEVLAPVWARSYLRELEDRYATGRGDRTGLENQIVATSLKYRVLCRFTAFVAVDVRVVNEGGQQRRVTQPVEAPAGWDMLKREEGFCEKLLASAARGGAMPTSQVMRMMSPPAPAAAPPAYDGKLPETVDSMLMDFDAVDESTARASIAPRARRKSRSAPGSSKKETKAAEKPAPTGPDLSAYRARADELRRKLES